MKNKLHGILTLLLAFVVQIGFAQEITVTGTVVDEEGLPLPGVNVIVDGTNRGTQTDFDGNYSIDASRGETLAYSYVGFQTQKIILEADDTIDVALRVDSGALDEVVVVAYGRQSKRSLVGSVASLGEDVIQSQQLTSVTQAIQGNVPGVNVLTSGGQPGENPTIRIRGVGSINASAEPLIIVDGAPFNGNINSISGDQIESMNVLKDAASTALYGSRGANGVIVITTKQGDSNSQPSAQVTAVSGFSTPAVDMHDVLGTDDYVSYYWEALRNNNVELGQDAVTAAQNASAGLIPNLGYNPYNVEQPVDANGNLADNAELLWETDWKKEMLRNVSLRQEYGVNFSGGSERTRYFMSVNYLDQEGSVKESDFKRITARLNLESDITDWLTLGLRSGYTNSKQDFPDQSGDSFQSSIQWINSVSSVYPLFERNSDGSYVLGATGDRIYDYGANRAVFQNENAVGSLYNYENVIKRSQININGFANIAFTDDLSFNTQLSYEQYMFDEFIYANSAVGYASNVNGRITQNRDITNTLNFTNRLTYDKDFGDHNIQADAIFEAYEMEYDRFGAQGEGFLPNVLALSGRTAPTGATGYINKERLVGYMGRAAYSFRDKYFIEGSYRKDGSTRFSTDTRWGDFYSVGASWVISDENFLSGNNTINFLKLRGSYGETGNNKTLDEDDETEFFPYLQGYAVGWNQGPNIGVLLQGITDFNLTWETTASANVGLDFGLFNNRIEGTIDYYDRESVDLLYSRPLAKSTGNSDITTNVGSIRNYGWEFSLQSRNIVTDDFSWSTGFNFSFDRNEITELTQESFIEGTKRWEIGRSLYDFYMQDYAGVDPEDGRPMWYTAVLDENDIPTQERGETTKTYSEAGRFYNGSSLPDIIGGFNTDFSYKNWDLNALLNFSFGSQLYDYSYSGLMAGLQRAGFQGSPDLEDRWQEPGDVTDVPRLLAAQNQGNSTSSRFLFDNDYIRLRALTLGYTLPSETIESIGLRNFRIFLRGDNLFTWHSHTGVDPEQSIAGTTNNRSFLLKTISLGLNVQF